MKVFLSWSGDVSHKVAVIFRDWLPSVIQSIEPYVSSEDIDKGARWSTDIAKELEDSTFGIVCVTKENIHTSWLNFEAGALSKTMDKSFVSPFLFDIKRSEVNGPILQFQSTIFEKEDIEKLIKTLNKACGESVLSEERIQKTFNVWYPTLKENLNKINIPKKVEEKKQEESENNNEAILEEVLNISRMNQKLLRSPNRETEHYFSELKNNIDEINMRISKRDCNDSKLKRKFHPMFMEELMHISSKFENNFVGLQITLSLFKNDYPWLYDAGIDLIASLKKKPTQKDKHEIIDGFYKLVEFTFEHPIMQEMYGRDNKEMRMMGRELPRILERSLNRLK